MKKNNGIPVINLFAGPGGLCEGFASLVRDGSREFDIRVSIEKDPVAHRTLSLRALFRSFPVGKITVLVDRLNSLMCIPVMCFELVLIHLAGKAVQ